MKLVLASKNKKKLVEMNEILSHLGTEVCSEAEAGVDVEVEETGTTFEENSLLKARAVMEASGLPAIADDSGLCVDAATGGGCSTCKPRRPGRQSLCPFSPAASPKATCSPPGGSALGPSPSPPRGRAASAMTRCFSCRR